MAVLNPRKKEEEEEKEEEEDHSKPWDTWKTSSDDDTPTEMPIPTASPPGKWPSGMPVGWPTILTKPQMTSTTSSDGAPASTASYDHSPAPENAGTSSTPTPVTNASSEPSSTNSSNFKGVDPAQKERNHSGHGALYAAAGVAPVVVLAILGVIVFFYLRKRKRQRQQAAIIPRNVQEMKARPTSTAQPYLAASPPVQALHTTLPRHPPPPPSPTTPQPVILGPIAPNSSGAYYTGIDTSDIVSMSDRRTDDRTGLGNPFADATSLHEEPPPPYRPRSVAPLSRDASVRTSVAPLSRDTSLRVPTTAAQSTTNLIERPERSPFEDPDDDAVSDVSGPTAQRQHGALSIVSDLSYQEEPTTARPSV